MNTYFINLLRQLLFAAGVTPVVGLILWPILHWLNVDIPLHRGLAAGLWLGLSVGAARLACARPRIYRTIDPESSKPIPDFPGDLRMNYILSSAKGGGMYAACLADGLIVVVTTLASFLLGSSMLFAAEPDVILAFELVGWVDRLVMVPVICFAVVAVAAPVWATILGMIFFGGVLVMKVLMKAVIGLVAGGYELCRWVFWSGAPALWRFTGIKQPNSK
jgi:hypothetical protein